MCKRLIALLLSTFAAVAMEPHAEKPTRQWPCITVKTADGWQGYFEPAMLERLQSDFLDGLVFGGVQFAELASGQPVVELPAELFDRDTVQALIAFVCARGQARADVLFNKPAHVARSLVVAFEFLVCPQLYREALILYIRHPQLDSENPEHQVALDSLLARCSPETIQAISADFRRVEQTHLLPPCCAAVLSPDGTRVVSFCPDWRLHVFDAKNGRECVTSEPIELADTVDPSECCENVHLSPHGQFAAVAFHWREHLVGASDKKPGRRVHYAVVFNVATARSVTAQPLIGTFDSFSPNGSKFALAHKADIGQDCLYHIHESVDGRWLDAFGLQGDGAQCHLHWLPDGEQWGIFPLTEARAEIHGDHRRVLVPHIGGGIHNVFPSADGTTLALAHEPNNQLDQVLDMRTMKGPPVREGIGLKALSPDGKFFVGRNDSNKMDCILERFHGRPAQEKFVLIEVESGKQLLEMDAPLGTLTQDWTRRLVLTDDHCAHIFDLPSGRLVAEFHDVEAVAMHEKTGRGVLVVKGPDAGTVTLKFFDCYTGQVSENTYQIERQKNGVYAIVFCLDATICRVGGLFFDAEGNRLSGPAIEDSNRYYWRPYDQNAISDDGSCVLLVKRDRDSLFVPTTYHLFALPARPTAQQLLAVAAAYRAVHAPAPR